MTVSWIWTIFLSFCLISSAWGQNRPQTPQPPFPYEQDSVFFDNPSAGIRLAGTLTKPVGAGPFPAVLLISGSGPQDRDETLLGHKPFAIIADHLSRRGYVVLRYDDRGFGASEGVFQKATTADFASDAAAGIAYLHKQPFVKVHQIGALGHSEGGMIVPLLDSIDFAILLAGPGVAIAELMAKQNEDVFLSQGVDGQAVQHYAYEVVQPFFEAIARKELKGYKDALTFLRAKAAAMPSEMAEAVGFNETQIKGLALQSFSPWFKYFVSFDPQPHLRKLAVPVLALNGDKDVQVDAQQNLSAIREALTQGQAPSFYIKRLPGLNHLFQEAETGAVSEYAKIEQSMAPEVLTLIYSWLEETLSN